MARINHCFLSKKSSPLCRKTTGFLWFLADIVLDASNSGNLALTSPSCEVNLVNHEAQFGGGSQPLV